MDDRSSRMKKKDSDFAVTAFRVVQEATKEQEPTDEVPTETYEPGKNPHAAALGKLGGKKGGPARAATLSPEVRNEIARKAAKARWGKV